MVYGETPDALQRGVRDVFGELTLTLTLASPDRGSNPNPHPNPSPNPTPDPNPNPNPVNPANPCPLALALALTPALPEPGEGECDAVFLELARLLGWLPELQAFEAALPPHSRMLLQRALAEEPLPDAV